MLFFKFLLFQILLEWFGLPKAQILNYFMFRVKGLRISLRKHLLIEVYENCKGGVQLLITLSKITA